MVKSNRIQLLIVFSTLIILSCRLFIYAIPKAPKKEFAAYHQVKNEARKSMAHLITPEIYSSAEFFWREAYNEWQNENEKWLLKRDYSESKRMILIALSMAEEAKEETEKTNAMMFETGKLKSFNQQEQQTIATTIKTSSQKWLSWVNEAINYSKEKGSIVIIVDKLMQICKIYNQGEPAFSFPVELGENSFSDKIAIGDNATPNGKYYITGKKEDFQSPYNKLLQINYTSHFDTSGLENPGKQAPDILQGKIYLHGGGGQGANWTNGSISLTDADMNKVFNLVKIGTPVIIVGTFDSSLINSMNEVVTGNH